MIQNDVAPTVPVSTYTCMHTPVVGDNNAGLAVAFLSAAKYVGGGRARGAFTDDPSGNETKIALRREAPPLAPAFRLIRPPDIAAGGTVVFQSRLIGGGEGVFRSGPTVVSMSGDAAPGLITGTLQAYGDPKITDGDVVVFPATIHDGPISGGVFITEGLFRCVGGDGNCNAFSGGTGTLEALAYVSDPVADRPGRFFCEFDNAVVASNFGIAFGAMTKLNCADPVEIPLPGVFRMAFGGTVETVALEGEPADPSTFPGGTLHGRFSDAPSISNTGAVAFRARTIGVVSRESIYLCEFPGCPATEASVVVTVGDLDLDGDVVSRLTGPSISDANDIAFLARAKGLNKNGKGISVWRSASNTIESIVFKGDLVPGFEVAGAVFKRFFLPDMSPLGRIAFKSKAKKLPGGKCAIFYSD